MLDDDVVYQTSPTAHMSCGVQPDGVLDSYKNKKGYTVWCLAKVH